MVLYRSRWFGFGWFGVMVVVGVITVKFVGEGHGFSEWHGVCAAAFEAGRGIGLQEVWFREPGDDVEWFRIHVDSGSF